MVQKAKAVSQVASEPKQDIRKVAVHLSATPSTKRSFRYDQGKGSNDHATPRILTESVDQVQSRN